MVWFQTRYKVCCVAFSTLMVQYFFRTIMSVAILAMVNKDTIVTSGNDTCAIPFTTTKNDHAKPFNYTQQQQGVILASYFYGYMATNFLGSISAVYFGVRKTMMVSIAGASLFSFLTVPMSLAGAYSYYLLVAARTLIGIFCGPLYSCMHELLGHWIPPKERTSLTVMTHSGNIVGLILTFFLGYFIELIHDGWKYYFYFSGCLGFIVLLLWVVFVYDHPWEHPSIHEEEKETITKALYPDGEVTNVHSLKDIPIKKIMTSVHVYLAAVAHMGNNYILYSFLTGNAKYLSEVHGYEVSKASVLSILPFAINFIFQLVASNITQYIQCRSKRTTTFFRKVIGTIGFVGAAIFMIPVGLFGCNGAAVSIVLLCLSMGFLGCNQCSFIVTMVDLAPDYSGITMGICNTIGSISGFVNPIMVATLTSKYGKLNGWKYAYIITPSVSLFFGGLWLLFGSSERQPWSYGIKRSDAKHTDEEVV